jgi:hypothetical protein
MADVMMTLIELGLALAASFAMALLIARALLGALIRPL